MKLTGAMDVDRVPESVVFQQVCISLLHCDAQRWPVAVVLGYACGLKDQELAAVHALADGLNVIGKRVRKAG